MGTFEVVLKLLPAIIGAFRAGFAGYKEIQAIVERYRNLPADEANIAAARQEILSAARIQQAIDDPEIRALLEKDGIDPESLRV